MFYRHFIHNFSTILVPMIDHLMKGSFTKLMTSLKPSNDWRIDILLLPSLSYLILWRSLRPIVMLVLPALDLYYPKKEDLLLTIETNSVISIRHGPHMSWSSMQLFNHSRIGSTIWFILSSFSTQIMILYNILTPSPTLTTCMCGRFPTFSDLLF